MRFKERPTIHIILGVLFLAIALAGCDPSYCDSTFVVTKFNDTNDGACDGDCSLREAVIGSNVCSGTQTIQVPAGSYALSIAGTGEDVAATGDLDITEDAIIIGVGAPSIDANGIDRVFEIHSGATVEIHTMLIHGGEEQIGAGIRNYGSLTMYGGVVANNTGVFPDGIMGGSSGGGISSTGTLVLESVQVRENSADHGGGISITTPGTLDMSGGGSMIHDNIAHETGGGLVVGVGSTATLTEVDIWRNEAHYDGGGMFNGGTINLNQSVVHENTSGSVGGALHNVYAASVWARETRFEDNSSDQGGAIQTTGLVTLYQSSITGNTAISGAGGGVFVEMPGLHLHNTTVSNNTASAAGTGGGIHNDAAGDVWLEWVTLAENGPIGIVNIPGANIVIENSVVAYNTGGNCTGIGFGSGGYNIEDGASCNFTGGTDISSTDPLLGPLANNGGLTLTHALLAGSPAIDTASPDMCTSVDQRGVSRPQGTRCDRGAYEKDVLTPAFDITPIPNNLGEVTGRVCYPSDFIPPMTLYFEDVDTNLVSQFDHSDGSDNYAVNLFPGTYVAYAYPIGSTTLGGSYSEAVLCGLTASCTDHTLVEFDVLPGQTTSDIDICDWYGEPGDIPPGPGPAPTETPTPPAPLPPISINFNADSYLIKEGKCTTLRWAVENAEDVFLDGELVEVLDARQVCPKKTTKYTLLAMAGEQEEDAFVTIEVEILPEPPEAPARLMFERVCNTKIYRITLSWLDRADNETGYRVYRDGNLIATLGANSTSYVDDPPFGGPYTYAVEAFNEGGASSQATVQPVACNPVR